MHQLLLRGLPPLVSSSSSSSDNDIASSSSSCVLLDGDWRLSLPREAVAAALMKRHLSSAAALALASTSSSPSGASLLSHPLTYDSALALADKVRVSRVRARSFNKIKVLCRKRQASASIESFSRSLARPPPPPFFNLHLPLTLFHQKQAARSDGGAERDEGGVGRREQRRERRQQQQQQQPSNAATKTAAAAAAMAPAARAKTKAAWRPRTPPPSCYL